MCEESNLPKAPCGVGEGGRDERIVPPCVVLPSIGPRERSIDGREESRKWLWNIIYPGNFGTSFNPQSSTTLQSNARIEGRVEFVTISSPHQDKDHHRQCSRKTPTASIARPSPVAVALPSSPHVKHGAPTSSSSAKKRSSHRLCENRPAPPSMNAGRGGETVHDQPGVIAQQLDGQKRKV